jgi:hypothetical protein
MDIEKEIPRYNGASPRNCIFSPRFDIQNSTSHFFHEDLDRNRNSYENNLINNNESSFIMNSKASKNIRVNRKNNDRNKNVNFDPVVACRDEFNNIRSFVDDDTNTAIADENLMYLDSNCFTQMDDYNLASSSNEIEYDCSLSIIENNDASSSTIQQQQQQVVSSSNNDCWRNSSIMLLVIEFLVSDEYLENICGSYEKLSTIKSRDEKEKFLNKYKESKKNIRVFEKVCKSWSISAYMLKTKYLSDFEMNKLNSFSYQQWKDFVGKHCKGKFLSQGVCKHVYCVENADNNNQNEAVSVMNILDLKERGMELAITNDLQISMLASALVSLNICPNLVQVFAMFQSNYGAPDFFWQKSTNNSSTDIAVSAIPTQKRLKKGRYQFIRMEFCSGGDMEENLRKNVEYSVDKIRSFMFQMFFALYSCREKISLRHYDLKLLNFFVTSGHAVLEKKKILNENFSNDDDATSLKKNVASVNNKNSTNNNVLDNCVSLEVNNENIDVDLGFGSFVYRLNFDSNNFDFAKLADFGTSIVGSNGLGDPISVQQVFIFLKKLYVFTIL